MFDIIYHERPRLTRPVMIMGFTGWANAGDVSSGVLAYLKSRLHPTPLAIMSADDYHDYNAFRPQAMIVDGLVQRLEMPASEFSYFREPGARSDVILFQGPEPAVHWRKFCDVVLGLAEKMGVRAIITLGGTYDYLPHWVDPVVSMIYSDASAEMLAAEARPLATLGEYHGDISIHTALMVRARQYHLPVVGLWGHAPVYIQTGNIKVHLAMMKVIKKIIGLQINTEDLAAGIEGWAEHIEELVDRDPRLKQYLEDIKRDYRQPDPKEPGRKKKPGLIGRTENGKGKVISFEDFLKRDEDR